MISIIIPVYNYSDFIWDAFRSILEEAKHMDDIELIIVNDGSTDDSDRQITLLIDSIPMANGYLNMQVFHRIEYIHLYKNMGVSVARNRGLAESTGEYITFLDADDMRAPQSLQIQKSYLDKHPKVDVVWGYALEVRGHISFIDAVERMPKLRVHPSEVNPQTVMYRRRVFERFGGWYTKLTSGEDKELSMRLGIHPESPFNLVKAKKLKHPMAFYRKHPKEKHKKRKKDPVWYKETKRIQKERLKQLKREGVTRENTPFPI